VTPTPSRRCLNACAEGDTNARWERSLNHNAQAYSIEAANVCHSHEWRVWQDVKVPDGKILMPDVISHATDEGARRASARLWK
jgi:hypothetical protein